MKKSKCRICVCWASLAIASIVLILVILEKLPAVAPSMAWKSRWPYLQEPAIEHLKKKLYVGMPYEEMVEIMGEVQGVRGGESTTYSYNVNSWYNRGLDILVKNGCVVGIFEYD